MLHFFSAHRLAALLFLFPLVLPGAIDVSLQGTFIADDNLARFWIQVATPSTVSIRTFSYAGGTNAHNEIIVGGGFDPVLTLFTGYVDAAGQQIAVNDDGGCGQVAADSVTAGCWDSAILNVNLLPGVYTLVLSQTGNNANGPTFGDGFIQTGNGNYTGPAFIGSDGRFWDVSPAQRDGHWALDILNVDSAAEIPEPATLAIVGIGLGAFSIFRRRT